VFSAIYNSILGPIRIVANNDAIESVQFIPEGQDVLDNPSQLTRLAGSCLEKYFEGSLRQFDLPLAPAGTSFQSNVWKHLQNIAFGKTCSYLDIANLLGDRKKTRAVGMANSLNPIAIIIPCHRVIGSNNNLTGYAGGLWRKKWLLTHESGQFDSGLFGGF
jgi:methylated-DNA-[protein]-cysteine S-methyltransferase